MWFSVDSVKIGYSVIELFLIRLPVENSDQLKRREVKDAKKRKRCTVSGRVNLGSLGSWILF